VLKPELKWKRRVVETGEGERERERGYLQKIATEKEREFAFRCVALRCG
jgi:hypothetical protein